jgi:hypothetical protein
MTLAERLVAIHLALEEAGVEHAIGGAIALAFWTQEPRGTRDIDLNVFVSPEDCETVLECLPDGIKYDEVSIKAIKRDGQARLWWDDTPVDLFFSNLAIHDLASRNRRWVPFEGNKIPVLGPLELAFFKAIFDRTRDWADIEEMLQARAFDPEELRRLVIEHIGTNDPRLDRLQQTLERADSYER